MELALLSLAAFMTSSLTAMIGLGGGVLLMLLMPGLLPLSAILPVHAVVQASSNIGRAVFGWRAITWQLVPPLALGAIAGAIVGGTCVDFVSLDLLPAVSGGVILIVTWLPGIVPISRGRFAWLALGFYQTALGMLAGATGPLGAAVLAQIDRRRDWLVVNTGVYMAINHMVRSLAYVVLGFAFADWWLTILLMSFATFLGSGLGSRLRRFVPDRNFAQIFRWLITLLALRMVALSLAGIWQ